MKTEQLIISHERQVEMLKKVKEIIKKLLAKMSELFKIPNLVNLFEMKIHDEDTSSCDPTLAIGRDVEVFVYPIKQSQKQVQGYCYGYNTYDPGVRYHLDGSGTPPSSDFNEVGQETHAGTVAAKALGLAFNNLVLETGDLLAEDEMSKEMEKEREQAEDDDRDSWLW